MCEFCTKHGEGKKWYLEAKNYSDDLLSDIKRRNFTEKFFNWTDKTYHARFNFLKALPFKGPILGSLFKAGVKRWLLYQHWGQVVPIEDVEKILEFTNSITRIPCICRQATTGKEKRTCFLVSINPSRIGIADVVNQSYFGGPNVAKFEKVDKKWALNYIKEAENSGMIHTIWTFKAPFTGGLCSCDLSTGCIPMKMYKDVAPIMFRAEYVACINADTCTVCKACMKICQFGAVEIDNKTEKMAINAKKCYGCGICRAVCPKKSVFLKDRKSVPEVAHLW